MVTWYLYPWDVLGDPAAVERLLAYGVTDVALAAAYHSVRAATPRHPRHRVVDASHAALYLPVRETAWRDTALRPLAPGDWAAPDAYLQARDLLAAHGIGVRAWVVLTHNSALGERHPDLVVRNAFGDRYRYALCPSQPSVRDYCARLVNEVARQDQLIVEACGPLGIGHQSTHEKTAGADWSPTDAALLSICFCDACRAGYPPSLASRIRGAVGAGHGDIALALGPFTEDVRAVRASAIAALRAVVPETATFHASADPWATGPAAAVIDRPGSYVIPAWENGAEALAAARAAAGPGSSLAAYVTILGSSPAFRGADDLHVYHFGLASDARLAAFLE
ncbi:hypothetical protein [Paractinoplanes atraurantiacus]|uniref:Uncharacterized protein n=1 Tax=Paractinoplanes atraurantiacus TaxID=1036182 RepID=A0A285K0X6_9ACTN|nr:hypothetical protein [Actinoplanes atraurantiacus]SNY64961.1 hypothetical protein SAMN05421748_12798 [Actinoplanes atraurantiacus]